jgi:hypothetical protein
MSLSLLAPNSRRYVVHPGILDDRAALVFTNGHCHSLALALHRATGGEMVAFTRTQKPFEHVLVRADDGRLIDIGGARTPAEVVAAGGHLRGLNSETLEQLTSEYGWVSPVPEVASAWVAPLLERVAAGAPHHRIGCFAYEFVLDGQISMHVEWSERDGALRLVAFGRRLDEEPTAWTRCSSAQVPENAFGEQVIDFTHQDFECHRRRFEKVIRGRREQIIANLDASKVIDSPVCPPDDDRRTGNDLPVKCEGPQATTTA